MAARWLTILLLAPCFSGCVTTTIVMPELRLGPSTLTLTTDLSAPETQAPAQLAELTPDSSLEVGLRSTIRF
ncbi:MAG: hypothetical protein FDZ69_11380 [Deltaproteobacteria bacterium]|nr:MAG: hypothetical protein FDZ69_11380 [Deltaproteobacteria bacterium]